jgi:hypothetical protein
MDNEKKEHLNPKPNGGISRRQVIIGAAATALLGTTNLSSSQTTKSKAVRAKRPMSSLSRYMAASAPIGDGRILITGGYDRPWSEKNPPRALTSAVIYDPSTGEFWPVASMKVPRARHVAVSMGDGRVAVLGGVGTQPTAAVEIFDPSLGTWVAARPMAQPRYDHTASTDGNVVFVFGGSSQSMLNSVETIQPTAITARGI